MLTNPELDAVLLAVTNSKHAVVELRATLSVEHTRAVELQRERWIDTQEMQDASRSVREL